MAGLVIGSALVLQTASDSAQPEKPASQPNAPGKLPEAKVIIDRFVKEIGGKEAFDKLQSQHGIGKFEIAAQGIGGDLEIFSMRPNKLLMEINTPGLGKLQQGFDGNVSWSLSAATGPMVVAPGKELVQAKEQALFDAVLHKPEDMKSAETIGDGQFAGKEIYKLKIVRSSGTEVTEFYDKGSGLLIGSALLQQTPLGEMMVTNVVSDYKKFNNILFPTKITQKVGPIEQTLSISKYEFNNVDSAKFELPPEVKALTNK
jgi:zinc protease